MSSIRSIISVFCSSDVAKCFLLKSKVAVDNGTKVMNERISDFYHKHAVNLSVKTRETSLSFNRNISYWEENEEWLSLAYVDRDYRKLGAYAHGSALLRQDDVVGNSFVAT